MQTIQTWCSLQKRVKVLCTFIFDSFLLLLYNNEWKNGRENGSVTEMTVSDFLILKKECNARHFYFKHTVGHLIVYYTTID